MDSKKPKELFGTSAGIQTPRTRGLRVKIREVGKDDHLNLVFDGEEGKGESDDSGNEIREGQEVLSTDISGQIPQHVLARSHTFLLQSGKGLSLSIKPLSKFIVSLLSLASLVVVCFLVPSISKHHQRLSRFNPLFPAQDSAREESGYTHICVNRLRAITAQASK